MSRKPTRRHPRKASRPPLAEQHSPSAAGPSPSRKQAPEPRAAWWVLMLPALAAVLVYLPSLQGDFVYDARAQILTDSFVHDPSNIPDVLSLRVLSLDVLDNNRPLNLLSLMVDSQLWGTKPFGYHLSNLLLHAANTLLLGLLLRRFLPAAPLAPLAAASLFAVHPVLSEAVCEVTYREDLLASFFTLGALLAAPRRPVLCLVSVFCAAASKESAWLAPLMLAACLLPASRSRRTWLLLAASAAAVASFSAARFLLQPDDSLIFSHPPSYPAGSLRDSLPVIPRIIGLQLHNLIRPTELSADYGPFSVRNFTTLSCSLLILGVAALQGWTARRNPPALLGVAVFWLALLPVSNLVPIYRPAADRYLYLPLAGLCLWLAAICPWRHAKTVAAAWLLAAAALLPLTLGRQAVWNNNLALWEDTILKNPRSVTAANNLGYALMDEGDLPRALEMFNRSAMLVKPEKPIAASSAGAAMVLDAMGDRNGADKAFRMAVEVDPLYAEPDLLIKALRIEPMHAERLRPITARKLPGE